MSDSKKVLVLGAGMCCPPLVKYLDGKGYKVLVGSRTLKKAEEICAGCQRAEARKLNVEDPSDLEALEKLTQEVDAVVSMLPYLFHPVAAKLALKHGKHFLTTSYVSDAMRALEPEIKQKGVTFVNECGVDPGMDHMSAMKVIHEATKRGEKLISFKSYCGGLPAPDNNDNPLGYKFSWAPRGVLLAARNSAKFLLQEAETAIPNQELFKKIERIEVPPMGTYEAVANRDSISYIDTYSIRGVETMKRGTLRNIGWSHTIDKWIEIDLLSIKEESFVGKTYADVIAACLGLPSTPPAEELKGKLAEQLRIKVMDKAIQDLEWLGMFSSAAVPKESANTRLDCLASAMLSRMQYAPGEKDMLLMKHEFIFEYPGGREHVSSIMVDIGKPNGPTSMSTTVATPVAIACHLVLSGVFTRPGLHIPVIPELYLPILAELEAVGISFREKVERIEPLPKGTPGRKKREAPSTPEATAAEENASSVQTRSAAKRKKP